MALAQLKASSQPGFFGQAESVRRIGSFLVSQNRYRPGARLRHHAHRHPFVSFVLSGAYTEYSGRRVSDCPAGTLGFHPAGEEHSDRFGQQEARVLGIEVECRERSQAIGSRFVSDGPQTRIASHIAREFQHQCPASDLVVECLATELMGGSHERATRRETPDWLATAVEIANDRYAERFTLADVASSTRVHPVHLTRQFRSRLGCSYGEFVRRIRLARALERLRGGSQPIAEVAAETGFADQSHLTRWMSVVVGMTPGAYRRLSRPRSTRTRT